MIRKSLGDYVPREREIREEFLDLLIKIKKILEGSVIIEGYVDLATQEQANQMQESMTSAVTNGSFLSSMGIPVYGDFTIVKKTVEEIPVVGPTTNLPLILGLAIGLPCAVIVIVISIGLFLYWRKRASN